MKLYASLRTVCGTCASRRIRKIGKIPGIVYKKNYTPVYIELSSFEIKQLISLNILKYALFTLVCLKKDELVRINYIQFHPCKDEMLHVDLQII